MVGLHLTGCVVGAALVRLAAAQLFVSPVETVRALGERVACLRVMGEGPAPLAVTLHAMGNRGVAIVGVEGVEGLSVL
jgi:hypothetical protein